MIAWYWKSVFPLFLITFISLSSIKKGLSLISPFIIHNNILTLSQYATVISLQAISSAAGKYLGSNILEHIQLRKFVLFISFLICCCLFGLYYIFNTCTNGYFYIMIIWNLLCFLNAIIWNSGSLITRHIIPIDIQGTFWSFICSSGPLGALLDNIIVSIIPASQHQLFLYLGIILFVFLPYLYIIYPVPTSLNDYDLKKRDLEDEKDVFKENANTNSVCPTSEVNEDQIQYSSFSSLPISLKIKFCFIGMSCIFFFIGHKTLLNWGLLSISSISGLDETYSHIIASCWEIGGLLGTLIMGPLSDRFPSYIRLYLCLGCALLSCLFLSFLNISMPFQLYCVINFILGFFIYIPESYIELITLESMPLSITGIISGYCGILFQTGTFLSTIPVRYFVNSIGFQYVHYLILITYLIASLCLYISTIVGKYISTHEKVE